MKPIHLAVLLAFGAGACVDTPSAVQIFQATPPDASCSVSTSSAGLLRGSLDLSLSQGYLMGFVVRSSLTDTPVVVGDSPLSGEDTDAVYLDEMEVSYDTNRSGVNLDDATVPIYNAIQGGEEGTLLLNLITSDALEDLDTATESGEVEVLVTLRLHGKTATGSEVETNEISYPIVVYKSGFACPSPQVPEEATEPCDPRGQNGNVPACVAP